MSRCDRTLSIRFSGYLDKTRKNSRVFQPRTEVSLLSPSPGSRCRDVPFPVVRASPSSDEPGVERESPRLESVDIWG